MRKVTWFVILAMVSAILVGCGEPATNAPEDEAFQKGLAEAAAKNPTPDAGKRGGPPAAPAGAKVGAPEGDKTTPPATK